MPFCHTYLQFAQTFFTGGIVHVPSMIEGALSSGQYMRSIRMNLPAGAGSQFNSLCTFYFVDLRIALLLLDELSLGLAPVIVERLLPVVRDYARGAGAASCWSSSTCSSR